MTAWNKTTKEEHFDEVFDLLKKETESVTISVSVSQSLFLKLDAIIDKDAKVE